MLNIHNLTFSYGKPLVINGLNWELETSKVHGLVGMNGAGKTTLFNLIAGWLRPNSGGITLNNSRIHQSACGFMETSPYFYPMITGKEYLQVFMLKNPSFNVEKWNHIFKLPLDEIVDNYSTGMLKKLSFMGILALNRKLLILDEPFNGLDFEAVRQVQQILPVLAARGKTIIVSSHITESLTSVSDTISLINQGKIDFSLKQNQFDQIEQMIALSGNQIITPGDLPD
ncbi:MAG: ATP-binding cassette domain-containing protein [Lentimicrobiaceae bacterium]|nr:ATP-binding cassette domain-containing protein [Lentimicrobiaceae bacterium]